jgi:hypothetical protein
VSAGHNPAQGNSSSGCRRFESCRGTERSAPTDRRRRPFVSRSDDRLTWWIRHGRQGPDHDDTPLSIDRIAADRAGSPEQRAPSLLKPLGRSKEVRQRDSQECHGPSAALFPALSVIPSQDRADTQAPPQRQWPIQGRVTDISALCNANRFLGLVSPWRTTVWGLGTEPGITDCTPGPDRGRCART